MNTSAAKVYPSYVYENKIEVSMHDGRKSTNVIDSSSRAVKVPCPTCPTGTFSFMNTILFIVFYILINYYEFTCYIKNSVDPDQLAFKEAS